MPQAINGPLQERGIVLDSDSAHANQIPEDYDTDLESEWSKLSTYTAALLAVEFRASLHRDRFVDGKIENSRNRYFQKQAQTQINDEAEGTRASLTAAMSVHLNIGQNTVVNTSAVFLSLETISAHALTNKLIRPVGNAQIQLPASFGASSTSLSAVSLRV